jgi:hypothetical protein
MRRSASDTLGFHGKRQQLLPCQGIIEQFINGNQGSNRAGGTGTHSASEGQILMQDYVDADILTRCLKILLHSDTGCIAIGLHRQSAAVAGDTDNTYTLAVVKGNNYFVGGGFNCKSEYIEAARNVGNGGRGNSPH